MSCSSSEDRLVVSFLQMDKVPIQSHLHRSLGRNYEVATAD